MLPAVIAGLGSLIGGIAANRASKKAQEQQVQQAKELNEHNRNLAMKTWEETNFQAQRQQMQKAGLNIGMMYGGTYSGGQAQGGAAQMPEAAPRMPGYDIAAKGIPEALMMKAQIDNINAQTENTKADTAKKQGVDTQEATGRIAKLAQETANLGIQETILSFEGHVKEIEANIADETEESVISTVKEAANHAENQARSSMVKAKIDERTQAQVIKQINTESQVQALKLEAQKLGLIQQKTETKLTETKIAEIVTKLNMNWQSLKLEERETVVKEFLAGLEEQQTEFNTSTPQQIKQWVSIFTQVAEMIPQTRGAKYVKPYSWRRQIQKDLGKKEFGF